MKRIPKMSEPKTTIIKEGGLGGENYKHNLEFVKYEKENDELYFQLDNEEYVVKRKFEFVDSYYYIEFPNNKQVVGGYIYFYPKEGDKLEKYYNNIIRNHLTELLFDTFYEPYGYSAKHNLDEYEDDTYLYLYDDIDYSCLENIDFVKLYNLNLPMFYIKPKSKGYRLMCDITGREWGLRWQPGEIGYLITITCGEYERSFNMTRFNKSANIYDFTEVKLFNHLTYSLEQ